jgi:hypothetical protein
MLYHVSMVVIVCNYFHVVRDFFNLCAFRIVGEVERNIYISKNIMNNFV